MYQNKNDRLFEKFEMDSQVSVNSVYEFLFSYKGLHLARVPISFFCFYILQSDKNKNIYPM